MNELSAHWRPHLAGLAQVMNKAKCVRWDRCIDGPDILRIYGWIDRPDGRADFVIIEAHRRTDVHRDEVVAPDCYLLSSNADPDINAELAKAIDLDLGNFTPCQRIEEVFGGMVTNAIKLEPKTCDCEAAIGRDRLISCECTDGEQITCPSCGKKWVHVCDEAEGCSWVPA